MTPAPPAAELILRRVGRPYVIEAVRMLEAGEGTVAGIDAALEGVGYARGPLRLLDEIGLDVDLDVDRALHDGDPHSARFAPPALQLRLVEEGRAGRVAGRGFYRYGVTGPRPDVEIESDEPLQSQAVVERLELAAANEAYRVVEEGLGSAPEIDAVMLQAGYPRGPFEIVDTLGLREVIGRLRDLDALAGERSGDQFVVAALLWQMATV